MSIHIEGGKGWYMEIEASQDIHYVNIDPRLQDKLKHEIEEYIKSAAVPSLRDRKFPRAPSSSPVDRSGWWMRLEHAGGECRLFVSLNNGRTWKLFTAENVLSQDGKEHIPLEFLFYMERKAHEGFRFVHYRCGKEDT